MHLVRIRRLVRVVVGGSEVREVLELHAAVSLGSAIGSVDVECLQSVEVQCLCVGLVVAEVSEGFVAFCYWGTVGVPLAWAKHRTSQATAE